MTFDHYEFIWQIISMNQDEKHSNHGRNSSVLRHIGTSFFLILIAVFLFVYLEFFQQETGVPVVWGSKLIIMSRSFNILFNAKSLCVHVPKIDLESKREKTRRCFSLVVFHSQVFSAGKPQEFFIEDYVEQSSHFSLKHTINDYSLFHREILWFCKYFSWDLLSVLDPKKDI